MLQIIIIIIIIIITIISIINITSVAICVINLYTQRCLHWTFQSAKTYECKFILSNQHDYNWEKANVCEQMSSWPAWNGFYCKTDLGLYCRWFSLRLNSVLFFSITPRLNIPGHMSNYTLNVSHKTKIFKYYIDCEVC